jgi:predicted transcriptional regulator
MEQITEKAAPAVETKKKGKRAKATRTKRTAARKSAKAAKGDGKGHQLLAMISRNGGATLPELMKALKWQKHSVRGAVSTLGKHHKIASENVDGVRTYKLR